MATLYSLQGRRKVRGLPNEVYWKATRDSQMLIQRLKLTRKLKGHQGCVNSVSWNCSGSRLLSGSDDRQLKIFDIGTRRELMSLVTSHQSNIFSAKFLPGEWYGDIRAVSCAGTGSVEYSEATPTGRSLSNMFKCHRSITYQVAVTPFDSNEFMTCEEKGHVRLYDLRVKTQCPCDGCTKDVLYSFPTSVSSMAVHPISPYYIAVGLGDGSLQVLDRRMAGIWRQPLQGSFRVHPQPVNKFSSGSEARKITCVQFNENGSQLLANYSEDFVYLFNSGLYGCGGGVDSASIPEPAYLSQFGHYSPYVTINSIGRREASSGTQGNDEEDASGVSMSSHGSHDMPNTSPQTTQAIKKIRFRGDWSDTGPEARPDGEGTWPNGYPLMNHMSRLFAQWMSGSLDSNGQVGERAESPGEERRRRLRRWWERRRQRRQENLGGSGETSQRSEVLVGEQQQSLENNSDNSVHLFEESEHEVESSDAGPSSPGGAAPQDRITGAFVDQKDGISEDSNRSGLSREASNDSKVIHKVIQSSGEGTRNELTTVQGGSNSQNKGKINKYSIHMPPASGVDAEERGSGGDGGVGGDGVGPEDSGGDGGGGGGGVGGDGVGPEDRGYGGGGGDGGGGGGGCGGDGGGGDGGDSGGDGGGDVDEGRAKGGDEGVGGGVCNCRGKMNSKGEKGGKGGGGGGDSGGGGGGGGAGDVGIIDGSGGEGFPVASEAKPHSSESRSAPKGEDKGEGYDLYVEQRSQYKHHSHHHCSHHSCDESSASSISSSSSATSSSATSSSSSAAAATASSMSCDQTMRSSQSSASECKMRARLDVEATIKPFMIYKGHRNARTMIKQANFFGENWILSGSDCGRVFVWDKWTGDVVNMLLADSHVVNCIQPHPSAHMIATSGVDYDIKLWEPVDDKVCSLEDVTKVVERNRIMLEESLNTISMPPIMFIRVLPYLNRRWRMRGGGGDGGGASGVAGGAAASGGARDSAS